jgi:mitochondrial fission protein ELM1
MSGTTGDSSTPGRVWLVLGDKAGDNAQVDILVEALGWTCERKHVEMLPPFDVAKPRYRPSLDHIDLARSDPLEPPWPDLILTSGRRPSMASLWVREQSGGQSRIVLLGKPSGLLRRFDLVILSSEVQIPAISNVLKIGLPLMRVDPDALHVARDKWQARFEKLPRPLVAVLVGGPTHPFVYTDAVIDQLREVAREVCDSGGTPYFTTSRRTPARVLEALESTLPEAARLFAWKQGSTDNPYLGLLALADGFVVTGDSLSMLVEVARLGRPLQLLALPMGLRGSLDQRRRRLARWLFSPPGAGPASRLREALGRTLHRLHLFGHTRDFTAIHDLLLERGLAAPVGGSFEPPPGNVDDDLPHTVERIEQLLAQEAQAPGVRGMATEDERS